MSTYMVYTIEKLNTLKNAPKFAQLQLLQDQFDLVCSLTDVISAIKLPPP
jgi:hypothetical protein